jgi:hypothetical protein
MDGVSVSCRQIVATLPQTRMCADRPECRYAMRLRRTMQGTVEGMADGLVL